MEITGKIIAILPERSGVSKAGNAWNAQEYVLETQEMYPKKFVFDAFGTEKIQQFNIQMGEVLTVSFDIDAREYSGRWYNSVRAWKVERTEGVAPTAPQAAAAPAPTFTPAPAPTPGESSANDDLPF